MRTADKQMDLFGKVELQSLLIEHEPPCVSIFMPTLDPGDVDKQPASLRLTQLLEQAEERLIARGIPRSKALEIIAPGYSVEHSRPHFWQYQSDGLAIFLAPNKVVIYQLPLAFAPQVVVDKHFYVMPLLPLLNGDGTFYLLALSQNRVRMFQGSRYIMRQIALDHGPHSLAEAQRYDQVEPVRQVHTAGSGSTGNRHATAVFTGQGTAADEKLVKKAIEHFLRQVDSGVREVLAGQSAPLLVASVDMMRGIYHEVSDYPFLLDVHIDGNPDRLSTDELHTRAWELIAPSFQMNRYLALEHFQQLAGQGDTHAVRTVRQVLLDAYEKRIDTLFVVEGAETWGSFDPATLAIAIDYAAQKDSEALLNLATIYTLRNRGLVYPVRANELPNQAQMAAILRY